MESINIREELLLYNLAGKWNDYIGVQKKVLQILREKEYFVDNEVINKETGMHIKINSKGIRETLGAGNRFQNLPKKLKQYKVASLRHLKEIIESAKLVEDNVENLHEENGYVFAYLSNELEMDGELVCVRISIKKRIASNWFWIHNIDENKKVLNYSTHPERWN